MVRKRTSDPMILEGVLILSRERDAVSAVEGAQSLLGVFERCAAAYLAGVRRVMVHGPKGVRTVEAALTSFNWLLQSRGLQRLAVRVTEPGGAVERRLRAAWEERDKVAGRRAVLPLQDESDRRHALTELQAVGADAVSALFAAVPVISPEACSGCDACIRVCPHDVLTQINDNPDRAHYHARPSSCDACGLCVGVCSHGAIKVLTMVNAPADIPLKTWTCSNCGSPTRAPEVQGRGSGPCAICAATGHHKKLFQVLP